MQLKINQNFNEILDAFLMDLGAEITKTNLGILSPAECAGCLDSEFA